MNEPSSVGTAHAGGRVVVGGDLVGRDKVVTVAAPSVERSMHTYLDAVVTAWRRVPKPVSADRGRERPLLADVYVDALTDALRAGQIDVGLPPTAAPRFSAVEAQLDMSRLALCGPRNAGKSSALRAFALLAGRADSASPQLVPIPLDADDSFGRWLRQQDGATAAALAAFVRAEWAFDIADLRTTERTPVFMWDHTYLLPADDRRKVVSLIDALDRWMPHARHIVAARTVALEGFELPADFRVVRLLPLGVEEAASFQRRYRAAGVDVSLTTADPPRERGDLVGSRRSPSGDDLVGEYHDRLIEQGFDAERAAVAARGLPATLWQLLRDHPAGISFFALLEALTGGERTLISEATALVDALIDDAVLVMADGLYLVGDQDAAREAACSALSDEGILRETVERSHGAPLMLDLVERYEPAHSTSSLRDAATVLLASRRVRDITPTDLLAVTQLRVGLLAAGSQVEAGDGLRDRIHELASLIDAGLDDGWPLPVADELRRLVSRARRALATPVVMTFRRAGRRRSQVSLPSRSGPGRDESTVDIAYPVWFAVEPLTTAQVAAILRRQPDSRRAMAEHLRSVRPEAWVAGPAIWPSMESAEDPAVGIDLDDAYALASHLTAIIGEQVSNHLEAAVPSVAEWGLLDTGLQTGAAVNLPNRPGRFHRPIASRISGRSAGGYHDVYGNVMEWTSTSWGSDTLETPGHTGPYEPSGAWDDPASPGLRLLRGGSWLFHEAGPRCACLLPRDARFPDVGFRPCVRPPVPAPSGNEVPATFEIVL